MPNDTAAGMVSCTLIGTGLIVYGLYQRSRVRSSENWPQVMGTITKAAVARQYDGQSHNYAVSVLYDYVANGRSYTGKRIGFGKRKYIRKKPAQAELERYPVNSSVPVYFNPDKPADAVLVRESPYSTLYIVLGILLLGVVLAILLFAHPPNM